jgi:FkbM family methyltransferase
MNVNPLRSWLLAQLPRRRRLMFRLHLDWLWQAAVNYVNRAPGPLRTSLHGFEAWLNPGNPYPFVIAEIPSFNRPLVELVSRMHRSMGRLLTAIDVGASVGNTALLLMAQCADALATLHCVEGDPAFFALLERNTRRFPGVIRHRAMLARQTGTTKALVHHHPGTAGASGDTQVTATTLDDLLLAQAPHYDVLKVDVDGSDGEALAGARGLLERDQPATIFEWHPHLLQQAGNDPLAPFSVLRSTGYDTFLWYTNKGDFSHFSTGENSELEKWRLHLLALQSHGDPHFDVIALPPHLRPLEPALASFGIAS